MNQQIWIALCVFVATVVAAEPPYYRVKALRSRSEQFNVEPEITKEMDNPRNAPYPPSGWRPMGQKFELPPPETTPNPEETTTEGAEEPPQVIYGPPQSVYGFPDNVDESPEKEAKESTESTESEESKVEKDKDQAPVNQQGPVYIILPESSLQKYYYNIQADPRVQQYSSSYSTYGAQQLSSPVYYYTPQYYYPWY